MNSLKKKAENKRQVCGSRPHSRVWRRALAIARTKPQFVSAPVVTAPAPAPTAAPTMGAPTARPRAPPISPPLAARFFGSVAAVGQDERDRESEEGDEPHQDVSPIIISDALASLLGQSWKRMCGRNRSIPVAHEPKFAKQE